MNAKIVQEIVPQWIVYHFNDERISFELFISKGQISQWQFISTQLLRLMNSKYIQSEIANEGKMS